MNQVEALKNALHKLGPKDQEFANSLLRSARPSEKQLYWMGVLVERAVKGPQAPKQEVVGSFAKVAALFAKAKQHLKYPKIHMEYEGYPITMALAAGGANAGSINVTDGEAFGSNKWYGRVDAEGLWTKPLRERPEDEKVAEFIRLFGENPAKMAGEYGRLSGRCCFCNSPLKDERSTAVGYGPVCAKNYGLAAEWKAAASVLEEAVA